MLAIFENLVIFENFANFKNMAFWENLALKKAFFETLVIFENLEIFRKYSFFFDNLAVADIGDVDVRVYDIKWNPKYNTVDTKITRIKTL